MSAALFVRTVERALRYRITDIETLRRIAQFYLTQGEPLLPNPPVDEGFRDRDAYRQGHLTDALSLLAIRQNAGGQRWMKNWSRP